MNDSDHEMSVVGTCFWRFFCLWGSQLGYKLWYICHNKIGEGIEAGDTGQGVGWPNVRGALSDSSVQRSVRGCGFESRRRSVMRPSPPPGVSVTVVFICDMMYMTMK